MRRLVLAVAAILPALASAWVDQGHMAVVAIAWEDLTPQAQRRVTELVRWAPEARFRDPLSAATWPDYDPDRSRRPWHFINLHFRADGRPSANRPAEENVVWAIRRFTADLKNRGLDDRRHGEALIKLLHFVGDVHQPLHTMSRDTERLPQGDRGGNDFPIAPIHGMSERGPVANLHLLWDFGGGLFGGVEVPPDARQEADLRVLARQIRRHHPRASLPEVGEQVPMRWAEEGFALRGLVYDLNEGEAVPQGYLDRVREVSRRRVALAGYRLADLLNRALRH
jgi:hypothetical protein